ncbi:MAG TPA: hypothetical protein VN622_02135 [Clostridia bacterium]|nr:hypothetical protein [Clostridia bacterium]
MAHPIQVAAVIDFATTPLRWTVGKVKSVGWVEDEISTFTVVEVTEPGEYKGLRQRMRPFVLPTELRDVVPFKVTGKNSMRFRAIRENRTAEALIADFPIKAGKRLVSYVPKEIDAWQMRDELLELDETTNGLAAFLSRYGQWDSVTLPREPVDRSSNKIVPWVTFAERVWHVSVPRTANEYYDVRELISSGLLCTAANWLGSQFASLPFGKPRPEFPHLRIEARTCIDALLGTITVDHLLGTEFRVCARSDCPKIFKVESKHKRVYCDQYCGHLESVRRNRNEAKS